MQIIALKGPRGFLKNMKEEIDPLIETLGDSLCELGDQEEA